jgi:anthranilate phosphoribosyltransferase
MRPKFTEQSERKLFGRIYMIKEASEKLSRKINLTAEEMQSVMEEIMTGAAATPDIVAFLLSLSDKGETVEEITAAATVMRKHCLEISVNKEVILDTCGTGGDRKNTFNVSTVAAFVAAGSGITVAKHGNRSVSSSCGSADILEAVGININMSKKTIEKCLEEIGIAFLFAPNMHPAMKYAMPARKEIARRTIFNILGPLCNPAGATHQLVGVFEPRLTQIVAGALGNMGIKHALVVHSKDGLDEITTTDSTQVSDFRNGRLTDYEIKPEDFGFLRADLEDLEGGRASDNVQILFEILNGRQGPKTNIVLLNAAAALYAADRTSSIKEGLNLAVESIESGAALKKLALLKEMSHEEN